MREARREKDPDDRLHILNVCWSLGVERGLAGGLYDGEAQKIADKLGSAERDQFFHGVMDGRALRQTSEVIE